MCILFRYDSKKPRYALLDTLLQAERDGLMDDKGVCEEVDTFMFTVVLLENFTKRS